MGGEQEVTEWDYVAYAANEYVHSPFYVDEAVAQFSTPDFTRAWYLVRDANYNVVAAVDDAGDVRRQRSFNPYGELVYEETFSASGGAPATQPWLRVGHQGLFYDRLNGDYASPPITTTSVGLYHNRNRSYSPHLGRFVQSDPNATGEVTALNTKYASGPLTSHYGPDLRRTLNGGFSLYQSYGSSPLATTDPEGLFFLFGDALSSILIRNTIFGATSGGLLGGVGSAAGGGSFLYDAWRGAVAGGAGGFAGAYAGSLFTNFGIWGTIGAGAVGGGVSSGVNSGLAGNDLDAVFADAAWGDLTGSVVAGGSSAVAIRLGLKPGQDIPQWFEDDIARGFQEFATGLGVLYTEFRSQVLKDLGIR